MTRNNLVGAFMSAGMMFATASVQAAAVDLTTGKDQVGAINGAYFANPTNLANVGTGVIQPFLSIQKNGTEEGFNTDYSPLPLDAKRATNFTGPITVGDVGTVLGDGTFGALNVPYLQFFLDINQVNNAVDKYLSLDKLEIALGNTGNLAAMPGPLIYNMDAGGDNSVLTDYDLFYGSGLGFDMTFLVPYSLFVADVAAPTAAELAKNIYLYAQFGTTGVVGTRDYSSNDGFEEFWAKRAVAIDCPSGTTDPRCGPPPVEIPEPGTVLLAGLALLGLAAARRRRNA